MTRPRSLGALLMCTLELLNPPLEKKESGRLVINKSAGSSTTPLRLLKRLAHRWQVGKCSGKCEAQRLSACIQVLLSDRSVRRSSHYCGSQKRSNGSLLHIHELTAVLRKQGAKDAPTEVLELRVPLLALLSELLLRLVEPCGAGLSP